MSSQLNDKQGYCPECGLVFIHNGECSRCCREEISEYVVKQIEKNSTSQIEIDLSEKEVIINSLILYVRGIKLPFNGAEYEASKLIAEAILDRFASHP